MNTIGKISLLAFSLAIGASTTMADASLYGKIKGRVIGILSDGDFDATTYVTRKLAEDKNRKDTLTLVSLNGGKPEIANIEVSNSVAATPESLNFSKDGRYVYVIARLGQRSGDMSAFGDLPNGNLLTIVDVSDPKAPKITDKVTLGTVNPESVRVSPDGKYVAVPSNSKENSVVQIISVENGKSKAVSTFKLADLGVPVKKGEERGGIKATFVDWHPSGKAISVNLNTRGDIYFFSFRNSGGKLSLTPWGNVVKVDPDPFVGRFMPDGRHYVTADWGRPPSGGLPSFPSNISVIRLGKTDAGTTADHKRISSAKSDRSSEGIAVSPKGDLIATVNMRETIAKPINASVSLLTFNSETGEIKNVGNTEFPAVLPEGASFDASGKYLLVSVFQYRGDKSKIGGVEVFEVAGGSPPKLKHIGTLPSQKGTHYVEVLN